MASGTPPLPLGLASASLQKASRPSVRRYVSLHVSVQRGVHGQQKGSSPKQVSWGGEAGLWDLRQGLPLSIIGSCLSAHCHRLLPAHRIVISLPCMASCLCTD